MAKADPGATAPATPDDIKSALGDLDEAEVLAIMALRPTIADIEQASLWLDGDPDVFGAGMGGTAISVSPLIGWISQWMPLPAILSEEAARMIDATYIALPEKAERELGWRARPVEEGMRETLGRAGLELHQVRRERKRAAPSLEHDGRNRARFVLQGKIEVSRAGRPEVGDFALEGHGRKRSFEYFLYKRCDFRDPDRFGAWHEITLA